MILLVIALAQGLDIEIKEKAPETRLIVHAPKEEGPGVLMIRRWVVTSRGGALEEGWADVSVERADVRKDGLRAECALAQPGVYGLFLGESAARIAVSRSDLAPWKSELAELRGCARRLEAIAADIDQFGKPSPTQAAQARKRLQQERERLSKVNTGFNASLRALEEALDRLHFFRTLMRLPEVPEGETGTGYTPPPKEKDAQGPTAAQEVKPLREVIACEGALLILDELRLLKTPNEDPTEIRIIRWRDADKALAALRQAHEALGGFPELGNLLKESQDAAVPDDLSSRIRTLRAALIKP